MEEFSSIAGGTTQMVILNSITNEPKLPDLEFVCFRREIRVRYFHSQLALLLHTQEGNPKPAVTIAISTKLVNQFEIERTDSE